MMVLLEVLTDKPKAKELLIKNIFHVSGKSNKLLSYIRLGKYSPYDLSEDNYLKVSIISD